MQRLYHISEEGNINEFRPRISKKQWEYKEYVWAITTDKIHHYILPRECPRICLGIDKLSMIENWIDLESITDKKGLIIVSKKWEEKINQCKLFKYEFEQKNFREIDKIAGYYVSEQIEKPISKIGINSCTQELELLNVELVLTDTINLEKIKNQVVKNLNEFSIIRWSNLYKM